MNLKLFPVIALTLLASACATSGKKAAVDKEDSFGFSVRHMIRAQSYSPGEPAVPAEPSGVDGQKISQAIKAYRSEKSAGGAATTFESSVGD